MGDGMKIEPTDAVVGARVLGVDLSDAPSAVEVEAIEAALERYGLLVFPGQSITPAEQIAFSRAFADLELTELEKARLDGHEEIFVVGNVGNGLVSFAPADDGGELEWHTDHIHRERSARASLLFALEVPSEGGDTLFACMYHAFDALSAADQRRYEALRVVHSAAGLEHFLARQDLARPTRSLHGRKHQYVERPLVRRHPRSGRKALYFGNQVTVGVVGYEDEDAARFVAELTAHACQPAFQYRHHWQVGDAVLWDNRRVLHAGTPYNTETMRRCLHRTTWRETQEA
tara:strand:+ start:2937 stop:3800 length:864 start_codon:yes stop_codon:yes gene_type:complete